jgi:hypothetical protein
MTTEYDGTVALQTNLTLADDWLRGMASGAASSGRTVQYCMPYPHDVLASTAHPAVTNARASGDYFHAPHQWAIGGTALFYDALNLLPFKDGFYSSNLPQVRQADATPHIGTPPDRRAPSGPHTTAAPHRDPTRPPRPIGTPHDRRAPSGPHRPPQVGGQTVGPETHPDREALMATLSGAMVGAMDGIGLLNASRLNATCRSDGTVLKPDGPATTTDECFRTGEDASTCFVYATHSDVPGLGRAYYLFSNDDRPLTPAMVGLAPSLSASHKHATTTTAMTYEHVLFDWYAKTLSPLRHSQTLPPSYEGTRYAIVAPVLAYGWVLLGEAMDKFVPLASLRFEQVSPSLHSLDVHLVGAAGESVRVCATRAPQLDEALTCQQVVVGASGGWVLVRFGA